MNIIWFVLGWVIGTVLFGIVVFTVPPLVRWMANSLIDLSIRVEDKVKR